MSAQSKLWYFESVDMYELLCPHRVAGLAERHTFTHYRKGDYVYFSDQPSRYIYLIAKGRVKIGGHTPAGKELTKAILGKGEIFGEMALAGEESRSDYALAMDEDTAVCPMTIEDMHELMAEHKPLNMKIFKLIGFRLKKLERRIENLIFKDARTRIVEFLLDLAEEKGQKAGFEVVVRNHYTHKDIASLTGTSRQTVTTTMNDLRDKNLITFDRRRILYRDLEKLRHLAGHVHA
ncbi:Crp/Fnr family transcriptional regulator [Roseivirga sp. BDSF3-8]|uniref:Crp/Fnr family transcriptional regulator n=1 Tax=Roseivirga sp. BDSF3-8 TaxID=3241598 RepID=UPI00353197B0